MFAVTLFFLVPGVQLLLQAMDPSRIPEETYLQGIAFGLGDTETQNLTTILAFIMLGICLLSAVLALGVLFRKGGMRHAAIGLFTLFAIITIPLAIAGVRADTPRRGAWFGLAIGLVDAGIVWLLLAPKTADDFERVESARHRAEREREAQQRPAQVRGWADV
jgi:hypothetical protein